jgi:hypothetical protein
MKRLKSMHRQDVRNDKKKETADEEACNPMTQFSRTP